MAPSVLWVTLAPPPRPPARGGEGAPVCRPGGARTRLAPEPRPVFAPGSARLSSEPSLRPKRQPHLRHGRESPPRGPRGSVSSGAGREARPRGVDGRSPGGPGPGAAPAPRAHAGLLLRLPTRLRSPCLHCTAFLPSPGFFGPRGLHAPRARPPAQRLVSTGPRAVTPRPLLSQSLTRPPEPRLG